MYCLKKHYQSYSLPLKVTLNKYCLKKMIKRGRRRWKTRRKKMNKKKKKLQPYIDFWDSETEADFSCPACVLLWCLSVPLCLFPVFLSLSCCCQSNQYRQWISFCSCLFFPNPFPLFVSPCHVFHILECQCATCWHCAWMITCLYIVIENRTPFPWCWQEKVWMYRIRISVYSVQLHF